MFPLYRLNEEHDELDHVSKPKNRYTDKRGLTHLTYRPRGAKYFVIKCSGVVVYNPTEATIPMTCMWCAAGLSFITVVSL